jgi:hypothetical protein
VDYYQSPFAEATKSASLALRRRGVNENTAVTVLTDGDAGLRAIHRQVAPQGEHVLDCLLGLRPRNRMKMIQSFPQFAQLG